MLATGSTHPMAESCLVLTKRGVSGDTLVTMRHADSRHDSFKPAPFRIGARERRSSPGGARRPRPFVRGRPKAAARMGSPAMIPDAGNIGADEALRLRQQPVGDGLDPRCCDPRVSSSGDWSPELRLAQ